MPKIRKGRNLAKWKNPRRQADGGKLRIVGGKFRGRQISYSGDAVTRPMKDNVREALFNLVGGWIKGKAAIDLFSGTGAMGLEALSRGATKAFLIERHFPTVRLIRENVRELDPALPVEIAASDTFFWARQFLAQSKKWPAEPWVIFCCPPYSLYVDRADDMIELIRSLLDAAPERSLFVVESDERFDPGLLPRADQWRIRHYSPALISVYRPEDDLDAREFVPDEFVTSRNLQND